LCHTCSRHFFTAEEEGIKLSTNKNYNSCKKDEPEARGFEGGGGEEELFYYFIGLEIRMVLILRF
jgi:hypothetical protein